jgi:hypothetical protein
MPKVAGIALWAAVVAGVILVSAADVRAADPCQAGSIPGAKGVCIACPGGSFAAAGATGCRPCAAGSFSAAGAASCTACPPGTSSTPGAASCTPAATSK